MDDKLPYRIPEVAAYLNVSRSKMYELMSNGALTSVHIDWTRLMRSADLRTFDSLTPVS